MESGPAMARTPKPESDPTRIGVERYLRFVAEGLLDDDRVELLDGVIVPMTPSSPSHAAVVHLAAAASYRKVDREEITGAVPQASGSCRGGTCDEFVAIECSR